MIDQRTQDSRDLWDILSTEYPEYIKAVSTGNAAAEIEPDCIGMVTTYKHLAEIIPLGRNVYDFGCSYAPQAWYFRNHKGYIGINPSNGPRLHTPNSQYVNASAQRFLEPYISDVWNGYIPSAFAIVNYVPDRAVERLVKSVIRDVFTFYPEKGDDPRDEEFHRRLSKSFGVNKAVASL